MTILEDGSAASQPIARAVIPSSIEALSPILALIPLVLGEVSSALISTGKKSPPSRRSSRREIAAASSASTSSKGPNRNIKPTRYNSVA